MSQGHIFLTQFIKNPSQVGSVWPSSQALSEAMVLGLKSYTQPTVVELGPGTGSFTKKILQKMDDPRQYHGFEVNERFFHHLREQFPSVNLYKESAELINDRLGKNSGNVDYVISGIPFTNLPGDLGLNIIKSAAQSLRKGGVLRFFLYWHTSHLPKNRRFIEQVEELFSESYVDTIIENMPPAKVFTFIK